MYREVKSAAEIAAIKIEQKNLDLYNEVKDKAFICKKDIYCKHGIFMQGSPVFLGADGKAQIGKIYDVTNWKYPEFDYTFSCFSDTVTDNISLENLSEYFEYSSELSLNHEESKRRWETFNKQKHKYQQYELDTSLWGVAAAVLASILCLLNKYMIDALFVFLIGVCVLGRALYILHKRNKIINEQDEFSQIAKQDLRELAFRGECRAACYRAYEEAKEQERAFVKVIETPKVNLLKDMTASEITMDALKKAAEYEYIYTE